MSDIQRDREERQHVIEVLKNMLDWMEAANMISSKPERIEAVKYAIASIETDLKYDLLYEETSEQADKPTTKNDLVTIHTYGLDEDIRCAMCTNSMKSDRGCDGSCVVNKNMYEAVMDVIEKRIQPTTKNDLEVDFKLKDYVSREAVRRIIKSPRTQEQMLNALNSLRNATECKAEDCINRDYTAKYVEEFANNEYVSQDEAETIYLIADGIRHIPSALPKVTKNDLGVDKEQLKTMIRGLTKWYVKRDNTEVGEPNTAVGLLYDDVMFGIDRLPSVTPQEPRWISVTEDAPPIGTICLWCNKQGSVFTSEITYRSEYISRVGKHGFFYNGVENYGDIVAWMPLPKAYSEVVEE